MSASSRGSALYPAKVREKVAREIARVEWLRTGSPGGNGGAHNRRCITELVLVGWLFDVHAAREHARSLVALGAEHDRFVAWTREQGLGPENREPGAFVPYDIDMTAAEVRAMQIDARPKVSGGWPGKLARAWPGDRRAPMGRSLARLGRSILDMLGGERGRPESAWLHAPYQTSECRMKLCLGGFYVKHSAHFEDVPSLARGVKRLARDYRVHVGRYDGPGFLLLCELPCPDCNGTGHNLRGSLPPVEVTPQLRRRRADQGLDYHGERSTSDTWLDTDLGQWAPGWGLFRLRSFEGPRMHTRAQLEDGSNGTTTRTRSVPRGEHRDAVDSHLVDVAHIVNSDAPRSEWPPLDERLNARSNRLAYSCEKQGSRERRGECLHAEQRRAKLAAWTLSPEDRARLLARYGRRDE